MYLPIAETEFSYIVNSDELTKMFSHLKCAKEIAIDLEVCIQWTWTFILSLSHTNYAR